MFCPACGSQLPETAKFCLECGVKLSTFAPGVHPEAGGNRTAPLGSPAIAAAAIAPVATAPSEGAAPAPAPSAAPVAPAATNTNEAAPAQPAAMQGGGSTLHGADGSPKRVSKTGTSMHGAQASQVYVDPGDDSVVVPMAGPSRKTLVLGGVGIAAVSLLVGAVGAWRAVKASRPQTTIAPPLQSESAVALLETPRSLPHATDPSVTRGSQGNGRPGSRTGSGTGGAGAAGGAGGSGGAEPNGSAGNPGNTGNTNSGAGNSAGTGGTAGSGTHANNGAGSANNGATRPSSGSTGGSGSQSGSGGTTGGSNAGNTAQNGTGNTGNTGGSGGAGGEIGSGGSAGGEVSGTRGPRAPASGGYVEGDATDATGTLSPSAFTFVYRHYRTQIASCHSSVTRGGQEVNGVLRLRVRIGTDGHVVRTRVLENTTRNEALATCVQNQVRTWRYPQPEGGEVEVDYPFGFGN